MTPKKAGFEMLERIIELVKSDEQLHAALVELLHAMTETEKAKADYQRSRIK